jgi:hypothetical protein
MITLPKQTFKRPKIRVLTRKVWGGKETSGGGWAEQKMLPDGMKLGGFELISCSRGLLPQVGRAVLRYHYGQFGNKVIGSNSTTLQRLASEGGAWSPDTDGLDLPNLSGLEIRIQASRQDDDPLGSSGFRTIWWGNLDFVEDCGWGGAQVPSGYRDYHLVDAFWRTKNWFLDRHGLYGPSITLDNCHGHPGYNSERIPGVTLGNKGSTYYVSPGGAQVTYHTHPGSGTAWSDEDAIENSLAVTRPRDEPLWTLDGATDLFSSAAAWAVRPNMEVWDFVANLCRRGRGRGAVLPDWEDDSGNPTGPLTCKLSVFAQVATSFSYTKPSGGSETIDGATANGTTQEIDLIGDHRLIGTSFKISDPEKYRVDYLESVGEPIEVLATLGNVDSTLEKGWTTAQAEAFAALDPEERKGEKWALVYQLQRLARNFNFSVGDGNGATRTRCDYHTSDNGQILLGTAAFPTSPLTAEILNDLPLFEGYDYQSTPTRYDGLSAANFEGLPTRRDALILLKVADDEYRTPDDPDLASGPMALRLQFLRDGFKISVPNGEAEGYRILGDTDVDGLGSLYKWLDIVLTVGIRLPNRMRMATGNANANARWKMKIPHDDLHLWLAHPLAIWGLETEEGDDGYAAKRGAGGGTGGVPGIIRDDRDTLAYRHNLAVAWYGPYFRDSGSGAGNVTNTTDSNQRRAASWTMRDCLFLPTFFDADSTSHDHPKLGRVITTLLANGQTLTLNTPISWLEYRHNTGETDVVTDWVDLEFDR